VTAVLDNPSAGEAVTTLRARVAEFADDVTLADDLGMCAARIE
jgi:hypothetical protein